jgi:hypothetical protein
VGSPPPDGIGEQTPGLLLSAQDMQLAVQAVAQQIPCAQCPFVHSLPSAQLAPLGLSPQDPPLQTAGVAQSALLVQLDLQTRLPHP